MRLILFENLFYYTPIGPDIAFLAEKSEDVTNKDGEIPNLYA